MPWQVDYLQDDEVVIAKASGPMTLENFEGIYAAGIARAQEHDTRQILIDARQVAMAIPPTQLYGLPALLEQKGLTRGYKVAIVVADDAKTDDNLVFLETIFYNRGFQFRVFTETREARTWLKPNTFAPNVRHRRSHEA